MFKPTAGGSRAATLTLNDNTGNSPQTVSLSGTGEDFSIASAPGSSTSVAVPAGQTVTYSLVLAPVGGLTGSVSFTCSGPSSVGTCTVSPSQASLSASNPTSVTASVATTTASGVGTKPQFFAGPWIGLCMLGLLGVVGANLLGGSHCSRRGASTRGALAFFVLTLLTACGGGGAGGLVLNNPQTSTDTYQFTIIGTYVLGGTTLQRNVTVSLTLK
jgi:hypothetical protein